MKPGRNFYDDAIRQFDSYVRSIYLDLLRLNKLDDTIIVMTSDHGRDWNESSRVPLAIRFPHAAHAGSSRVNVERLDIAPTILSALGFVPPSWMQGRNLLDRANLAATATSWLSTSRLKTRSVNVGEIVKFEQLSGVELP